MKAATILCTIVALSGCATAMPIANTADVKSNDGSPSIDVYQNRRNAGEAVPEYFGDQLVAVRSYEYQKDRADKEIAGASCTVTGAGFSVVTETPAQVRVPLYRSKTGAISAQCEKPGYSNGSASLMARDVERGQAMATGAHFGLIGFAVGAVVDAASDHSNNNWAYVGELKAVLRRLPEAGADAVAAQ